VARNRNKLSPEEKARDPKLSIRRMIGLAKPQMRRLALGTVFLIVGSAASLAFPQGVRKVVDEALAGASPDALNRAAILMAVVSMVFGLSIALRYVLFTVAGERVVVDLRAKLYRAILDQEVAFFDARRTGELTSRLASDTSVLQNAVSVNLSMALRSMAQAAGAIVLLVWTSPILAGLMLAVVPAVAIGAVIYGKRVRRLARDVQDALASAGEIAEESIGGLRTVRAFTAEAKESARYAAAVERSFEFAKKRIIAGGTFMAVASFSAYSSAVLVFWYGGRMVARGDMSIGGLTSFLMYTLIVAFALGGLVDLWADFMRAAGAAERVFDLIDRVPAMAVSGGLTPTAVQGRVELESVTFAYPTRADVPVLEGFSLLLAPGEVVAVVGPSGAGKSTVASLITRFYDPQAGAVRFDDHNVLELDARWLRSQIGVVAQEPVLFSTSIIENIRYGKPDASVAEVHAAAQAANAHEFILRFPQGYETAVGERGVQLSGGQKQRIAIARALLKNPRVLILDEATSALDAESEHLVQEALERLMQGRTTLIIAHRLSTVMRADRVVVLSGGKVAQSGTHASLVREDGIYRRLVERQFAIDVA
jgi:ABC transporter fused permease/ATP-binding protein